MNSRVAPAGGSRLALKAATRTAHDMVDTAFSRFDLADPQGYRAFLLAHFAVLPWCESRLSAAGAAELLPDWAERQRTPALLADLAATGGVPDRGGVADGVGAATPLDAAAAFGMLYVLEGSRLGGAILARRVAANPDASCREATRYLRHGAGRGLWPRFVTVFDASPTVVHNIGQAIASARATFARFEAAAHP